MARYGFDHPCSWIRPKRMGCTFPLETTAMLAQVSQKTDALHGTTIVPRSASAGTPRRPSSRRSSRTNAIACARFSLASSFVRPWPLAPGISGQYAMNHSSSRSKIAVNSFCIAGYRHSTSDSLRDVTEVNCGQAISMFATPTRACRTTESMERKQWKAIIARFRTRLRSRMGTIREQPSIQQMWAQP